ncbi:carboxymuconolactone decarboxylase family protein [Gordonia neofelifaecis]|uniref:Carboxymuconolactone decarboxylase n=1 Tax=Gordonia neofelifaecis NRRL B-59395 TaxID=644548 RepID=F1YJ72_9ACTN|nr:carboxymuconolactone decarboxylase [Gordonia neofelifaecis]EGD55287.1 carboxymuconolactone decarboxylase [Gordonia neofelifaecis NRRL B-59395]
MGRVEKAADDDVATWLMHSPQIAAGLGAYSDAVYNRSRLPLRVREIARMNIALANECMVCQRTRETADDSLDEDFYDHVGAWASWPGYSDTERIAAEFAERFAADHTGLRDDEDFWARCKAHFDDDLLVELTLSCGLWLAAGRAMRVLDVGQSCTLTLNTETVSA